ncbi:hypothetical protein BpHYR1_030262 [Brachionus plicatilis]|uniref:Transmembrane protein n=1 Tax=Brachionus plicatilis TaxID=10195 RepID=A0A3M7RUS4_BRAPC|nr:hypothetical protein BpHYR1_030262 [Brachionus plicatilis]
MSANTLQLKKSCLKVTSLKSSLSLFVSNWQKYLLTLWMFIMTNLWIIQKLINFFNSNILNNKVQKESKQYNFIKLIITFNYSFLLYIPVCLQERPVSDAGN